MDEKRQIWTISTQNSPRPPMCWKPRHDDTTFIALLGLVPSTEVVQSIIVIHAYRLALRVLVRNASRAPCAVSRLYALSVSRSQIPW